jgi:hypothetical protein
LVETLGKSPPQFFSTVNRKSEASAPQIAVETIHMSAPQSTDALSSRNDSAIPPIKKEVSECYDVNVISSTMREFKRIKEKVMIEVDAKVIEKKN